MTKDYSKDFIGLTKKSAQGKAEQYNFIFRLIRIDDKDFLPYPDDVRDDRICIEMQKGEVVKATIQ